MSIWIEGLPCVSSRSGSPRGIGWAKLGPNREDQVGAGDRGVGGGSAKGAEHAERERVDFREAPLPAAVVTTGAPASAASVVRPLFKHVVRRGAATAECFLVGVACTMGALAMNGSPPLPRMLPNMDAGARLGLLTY